MTTHFVAGVELATEVCCRCGVAFAMPLDMQRRRRDDHESFYCPAGHRQHYTGPTEAMNLRRELELKAAELARQAQRADVAAAAATHARKAHQRIRARIANGVCPCCNRTFQNLLGHMRTEHPNFGRPQEMAALRRAFAMSQADVAREAGVSQAAVSAFEHGRAGSYATARLNNWLQDHGGAADAIAETGIAEDQGSSG